VAPQSQGSKTEVTHQNRTHTLVLLNSTMACTSIATRKTMSKMLGIWVNWLKKFNNVYSDI